MGFQTSNATSTPRRRVRFPLLLASIGAVIVLGLGAYYGASALVGRQPTPEQVVQKFKDEGLSVGKTQPVEQERGWLKSPTPEVQKDGVHFLTPSICRDCGGRVYSFDNERDLKTMRDYYDSLDNLKVFGPNFGGYTYRNGLLLLQIGDGAKKSEAEKYARVFKGM